MSSRFESSRPHRCEIRLDWSSATSDESARHNRELRQWISYRIPAPTIRPPYERLREPPVLVTQRATRGRAGWPARPVPGRLTADLAGEVLLGDVRLEKSRAHPPATGTCPS